MNTASDRSSILIALLAALMLAGCSTPPERTLSRVTPAYATLPNGHDPVHPDQLSPLIKTLISGTDGNFVRMLERKHGRPLNLLSLSGGGQNGAFGAGFLLGWRESGRRPQFDIVGGVSTGALLATHALLDTPADDAALEAMYTQVTKANIYHDRSLWDIVGGADSLKDTAPLRALIAEHITAKTLERVAAAAAQGRFVLAGTTNVDYDQTWVWNLSLIARDGNLDLYRKVLLASASFPIVFPPVEIDGHLFVDGAARSNLVVPGMGGEERPPPPLYGPGTFYLIDNGKLDNPPEALRRELGDVAATTIGVMMNHSMNTSLMRSFVGVRILGYQFKMVSISEGVNIGKDPLAFDSAQMRAAFDAGRALGKQPNPWMTAPDTPSGDLPSWATKTLQKVF